MMIVIMVIFHLKWDYFGDKKIPYLRIWIFSGKDIDVNQNMSEIMFVYLNVGRYAGWISIDLESICLLQNKDYNLDYNFGSILDILK